MDSDEIRRQFRAMAVTLPDDSAPEARIREREHIRRLRGAIVSLASSIDGDMSVYGDTRIPIRYAEMLRDIVRWSIRELPDLADKP